MTAISVAGPSLCIDALCGNCVDTHSTAVPNINQARIQMMRWHVYSVGISELSSSIQHISVAVLLREPATEASAETCAAAACPARPSRKPPRRMSSR